MPGPTIVKYLSVIIFLSLPTTLAAAGDCVPGPNTLCFNEGRFSVEVDWQDPSMNAGQGQVLPPGGDDWGFFYFDDSNTLELLAQVLDGCANNGHYWVFLAGLSDYEQTVTVTDTVGGGTFEVDNLPGKTAGSFSVPS